ncbi:phage tail sheath family protein [Selenomonadales bacterium OttesenSCG-928-I06]|nr:phage tail sheath family protein [Selenomonadales bacterium OttesenSCG-928-I06]
MAYRHGIYGSENPTSIIPPTRIESGLPVVVGTAPIHLATDPIPANTPILCYNYAEAVKQLGMSKYWGDYSLCEMIYSQFALFAMAPVVFINVLDVNTHKITVAPTALTLENRTITIDAPVILSTLEVKLSEAGQPLIKDVDYTALYDSDEKLVITALNGGAIGELVTSLTVAYDEVDPSAVDKDDIIGGVDINTGQYKGLELINQIFSYFRLIPGLISAPGWSTDPEVAAIMTAKAKNVNGIFWAMALVDIPTDEVKKYSDVANWKNQNNYIDKMQMVFWPKVKLGDKQYYLSTQATGVICTTDAANDDVPYWSPSNHNLQSAGTVLEDGTEIMLAVDNAAYLNGQGVVSGLNFIGGWKLWGNRTGVYPASTDPKDSFIPIRRMFNWINNELITTYWSKIDAPMNKRFIDTIVASANVWLNSLTSRGYILGGRVEFREDENSTIDLMDGIVKFHVYITPPSPAREIDFIQEYDPTYLKNLFGED